MKIRAKNKVLKKNLRRIKKAMGPEGVKFYRLLLDLADENGQIWFEGSEEDMIREIQRLYAVKYGGQLPK